MVHIFHSTLHKKPFITNLENCVSIALYWYYYILDIDTGYRLVKKIVLPCKVYFFVKNKNRQFEKFLQCCYNAQPFITDEYENILSVFTIANAFKQQNKLKLDCTGNVCCCKKFYYVLLQRLHTLQGLSQFLKSSSFYFCKQSNSRSITFVSTSRFVWLRYLYLISLNMISLRLL